MRTAALCPLLRHTARAITWLPLTFAATIGLAIVLVPEALTAKLTTTHVTDLLRVAAALALAAIAQRLTSDTNAGVLAAPAVLGLTAVTWFLPRRVALVLGPTDPQFTASHHRWAIVLGIAVITFVLADGRQGLALKAVLSQRAPQRLNVPPMRNSVGRNPRGSGRHLLACRSGPAR